MLDLPSCPMARPLVLSRPLVARRRSTAGCAIGPGKLLELAASTSAIRSFSSEGPPVDQGCSRPPFLGWSLARQWLPDSCSWAKNKEIYRVPGLPGQPGQAEQSVCIIDCPELDLSSFFPSLFQSSRRIPSFCACHRLSFVAIDRCRGASRFVIAVPKLPPSPPQIRSIWSACVKKD